MGTGGSPREPRNEFRTACKTSRPTTPGKCGALDGAETAARHTEGMICASKSQRSGRGRQNFENSPSAGATRILPAPIRSTPTASPSPPHEGALLALLSVCVPVTALGLFCTAHPLRLCRCPPRRGGHQPPKKIFFQKRLFCCIFVRLLSCFSCIGRGPICKAGIHNKRSSLRTTPQSAYG